MYRDTARVLIHSIGTAPVSVLSLAVLRYTHTHTPTGSVHTQRRDLILWLGGCVLKGVGGTGDGGIMTKMVVPIPGLRCPNMVYT